MKKTRLEDILDFFTTIEKIGYTSYFLTHTNDYDLYQEISKKDNKEGIYVTENDLFVCFKNNGELNIKVNMEQKELLDVILQQKGIDYTLDEENLFIQTYKGEIKEVLNEIVYGTFELKPINRKEIFSKLEGSIETLNKNLVISLVTLTDDHNIFVVIEKKKNKDNILDSFFIDDCTELLLCDMLLQKKYDIPSYITGVCQVKELNYQDFRNIRNNILRCGMKEKNISTF